MRFAVALFAMAAAAFADGGMVAPPDVAIEEFGQVAIIRHQDGMEQLAVASSFRSEATDFAWILPLPSEPVVDSFNLTFLSELQNYCRPFYRSGSGFGCAGDAVYELGRNSDSLGVEELGQGVIGPYAYQVLRTAVPETLAAYLRTRDTSCRPTLRRYSATTPRRTGSTSWLPGCRTAWNTSMAARSVSG